MCRGKKFILIQVNGHGIMSLLLANRQDIRHSVVMFIDPAQSEYYKTSRFINKKIYNIAYHSKPIKKPKQNI